ncbi:MAG TPA: alpha/beta hydrolase [Chloroflexia bacterium]|nr:alpha/beta hydrolase [Chloroflexia bacterium]
MKPKTTIEQQYCQTKWGQVSYWLSSSLETRRAFSAKPTKIKVVLFLHGVGGSGRYWFSYLEELAREANPVVALAPDLLGFGASDKPAIDYTSDLHLTIIETIIEKCLHSLPSKEFTTVELELVGHSMGGILALLLAGRLVNNEGLLKGEALHLTKLALLGTPYASPKHDLEQEVLRSPLNRAMLSRPLICELVHHSLKMLWPLVLFLIRKGWVTPALPYPVVADYMQHTCQSYTSSAHHVIFETNLEPVLNSLQGKNTGSLQTLLIYSRADGEVPWQHGQELAVWFNPCRLELFEQGNHQLLGQLALKNLSAFLN